MDKVCTDRTIEKEILKITMEKIWRISKLVVIHEVVKNLFTITFDTELDKLRVLDRRPWLFDNHLFILKQLDSLLQLETHAFNTKSFWLRMYKLPVIHVNRHHDTLLGKTMGKVENA